MQIVLRELFHDPRVTIPTLSEPPIDHGFDYTRIARIRRHCGPQGYILAGVGKVFSGAAIVVLELAVLGVFKGQVGEIVIPNHFLHFRRLRVLWHLTQRQFTPVFVVSLGNHNFQVVIKVYHIHFLASTEGELGSVAANVRLSVTQSILDGAPVDQRGLSLAELQEEGRNEVQYCDTTRIHFKRVLATIWKVLPPDTLLYIVGSS